MISAKNCGFDVAKITVLNDNRNDKCELENEHGFSIYIEVGKYKLLLD